MRRLDSGPEGPLEYIDATADVQAEESQIAVDAGVADLHVMFKGKGLAFPVELTIETSTGLHRGVHMSRLVRAANSRRPGGVEQWLKWICTQVNRTQPGTSISCRFQLPYDDMFVNVAIRTTQKGALTYKYSVTGMTACPCSKKMIGVGHMQRAEITLIERSGRPLDSVKTVGRILECFSAVPREEMKRLEEARKILEAQSNPRFAEDLVRECMRRFPRALFVSARCFESIHVHDAVATWSARPGWVPSL